MRFFVILLILVSTVLAGLFVYGQMMEPETRTIEVDADHAAS